MKLNVRTLQHTTFTVTVTEQDTILQLKEKIVADGNAPEVGRIKLIFKGVILKDNNLVGDSELTEDVTLVMMVTQATSNVKPTTVAAAQPQPVKTEDKQPTPTPKKEAADTEEEEEEEETEEFKQAVKNIIEMGYTDELIVSKALRLSGGDPNRAVEMLESGEIFEVLEEEDDMESGDEEDEGPNDENAPNPLEYLRNDPQFQQMRSIIQANPQLLPHFIEQLRQTNPDIFDLISQNSHSFVRLMQEGLDDSVDPNDPEAAIPQNIIRVTEDEKAAIERLEQLGFDRARAVEAFFACDKNEELAANFLLESMNDE